MSDVSDPEDEIIEIAPKPKPAPQQQQQRACGARRAPPQKPPGVDKWPAIYTTYLNANRTKAQVRPIFSVKGQHSSELIPKLGPLSFNLG